VTPTSLFHLDSGGENCILHFQKKKFDAEMSILVCLCYVNLMLLSDK